MTQVLEEPGQELRDSSLAVSRQSPQHRPADEDGVGAERQGSEDVQPAPYAPVHQDRGPAADGRDHVGQRVGGGHRPVELSAPVVRDHDSRRAGVEASHGVVAAQNALDQHGEPGQPCELADQGRCG